ncbi:MAG: GTPase Era [Thermodesulfovibrionales bacterium]|nr:GTPase Era [Thermodesulfovibrionales bacterium]
MSFRSGYVSITGRPNVGKSTLLNTILGQKIAAVTEKPQTTRNRIIGIKNLENAQIIFIDTPGIHKPRHKLGEFMVKEAEEAIKDVDIVLLMVEPWSSKEVVGIAPGVMEILEMLRKVNKPVMLVINKIDRIKKPELLPLIDQYSRIFNFREIVPISALYGDGVDSLLKMIVEALPEGAPYYPQDQLTDQVERFIVSELIREQVMKHTEEEVPHSTAVEIVDWKERENGLINISANIYVERESQKGIIIGKGGQRLKLIGSEARKNIEGLLGTKVFLELWVKVKKDWRNNINLLRELGFK